MSVATRPGRQRSRACDDAIVTATLDLLREAGYAGLTMSAVIERSGVSSATLYRRWPTKQALVVAAVQTLISDPAPEDMGSLAGDIDAFVRRVARSVDRHAQLTVLPPAVDDDVRDLNRRAFIEPRLEQLQALLDRAVARGDLERAPQAEPLLSLVVGPLYHRAFILGEKVTPAFLRIVGRAVLGSLET
jgi:AcrR family transcriptional regulator